MTVSPDEITPADSPKRFDDWVRDPVNVDLSTAKLAVGDLAYDFELPLLGGGTFRLLEVARERPVVLVFGSYT
jgi:hypothetical protein